MREPVKVLKSLLEQATNKQYKFKRLYRNLYNPEFYFLAYKDISQSQGSMTPGVDGKSLDGMSEKRISALIESIKDFSYQPNSARRVYIEKKNSTSGRKKLIEKRVPRDYSFSDMLGAGQTTIKNASGTWMKSPDGIDLMACKMLYKFFREYQETGVIQEHIEYFC